MSKNEKYGFDDILDSQKGIFGSDCAGLCGSAMDAFSEAKGTPDPQGMMYEVVCENCGNRKIIVEWPEMVAIKHSISPHIAFQQFPNVVRNATAWGFDQNNQCWFPDIRCSSCNWQFRMLVHPGEVERGLRFAVSKGWLSEQAYSQIANVCARVKQSVNGR